MPKMKTKKAASRRFRVTGKGLLKRGKAFKRHNTGKKSAKTKKELRAGGYVVPADVPLLKRMLPFRARMK